MGPRGFGLLLRSLRAGAFGGYSPYRAVGVLALFPEDGFAFSISVVTFNDFSLE